MIGYDAQGQVTALERRDGTGALSATTTATYTPMGDVETVDGPLAGSADTSRLRYDAARRVVGVIGPDPDGSGALPHRATRTSYRSDGLPTAQERGTVASQSDGDWAAFSAAEKIEVDYDGNDRPVVQRLVNGGTPYALTQTSYDALGRPACVAQRMNPAEYASLPSDACTLDTEGSFGPDRITRTTRDEAGQVTLVESGVGSSAEADEVATAWTGNGRIAHVTDAEGNRTTYEYDAYDRLVRTLYPNPTQGAGTSNTTDDETLTLDENGNVVERELRDGQVIAFSYDARNRATFKDLPGSEPDVSYSYDLLGRLTGASTSAQTLSFTFDALGRNLTQAGPNGTMTSAWDAAGRRTRLTYPDGFYVAYDHLVTGEVAEMKENGSTTLATFAYDALGRRDLLTYGDGSTTDYGYDAVSRLSQLAQDMNGSVGDLTLGFTHNPASQIVTNTRSNDYFSYAGLANGSQTNSHNGLNQIATSGFSHDARGNLTSDGTNTFSYSSENLLTGQTGAGGALLYDPLMRLAQTAYGFKFGYDGLALVEEYSNSTLVQRYVHGPGTDEPLIWYDQGNTRRYLHADERGSIVAISQDGGTTFPGGQPYQLNEYDEYGQPMSNNLGRFGYTGQVWLQEHGLWYYKARMYDPGSSTRNGGRFMQIDPIGYGDQRNLYAYAWNDPLNAIDPTGTYTCPTPRECEGVERARQGLLRAARDLTLSTRGADRGVILRDIANILGEPNTDNMFFVKNESLDPGTLGSFSVNENGGYMISMDFDQINRLGGVSIGAGVLAHEVVHDVQQSSQGSLENNQQRYRREIRAYEVQSWVGTVLGALPPGIPRSDSMTYSMQIRRIARDNCNIVSVREGVAWRRGQGGRPLDGMCQ